MLGLYDITFNTGIDFCCMQALTLRSLVPYLELSLLDLHLPPVLLLLLPMLLLPSHLDPLHAPMRCAPKASAAASTAIVAPALTTVALAARVGHACPTPPLFLLPPVHSHVPMRCAPRASAAASTATVAPALTTVALAAREGLACLPLLLSLLLLALPPPQVHSHVPMRCAPRASAAANTATAALVLTSVALAARGEHACPTLLPSLLRSGPSCVARLFAMLESAAASLTSVALVLTTVAPVARLELA